MSVCRCGVEHEDSQHWLSERVSRTTTMELAHASVVQRVARSTTGKPASRPSSCLTSSLLPRTRKYPPRSRYPRRRMTTPRRISLSGVLARVVARSERAQNDAIGCSSTHSAARVPRDRNVTRCARSQHARCRHAHLPSALGSVEAGLFGCCSRGAAVMKRAAGDSGANASRHVVSVGPSCSRTHLRYRIMLGEE